MSYLLTLSPLDFSKNFAFGLGVGVGLGVLFRKIIQGKQRKTEHLISCLKQLAAEVRQLRETLLKCAKSSHELAIEDDDNVSSDEEFYDSEKGAEIIAEDLSSFFENIDKLQSGSSADHQDAYNLLISKTNEVPDNCDLLWRYAKAQYQISSLKEKAGDLEAEKVMNDTGIKTAEAAVQYNEENYRAHQWYAILVGNGIKHLDNKGKIIAGYKYKEHIERAIELNGSDATSFYLLGRYLLEVYMLPWYMRKAAAALFADPPTASIDDALNAFIKAEELRPGFWAENPLYIGKCYYQKSEYSKAKQWLTKTVEADSKTEDDKRTRTEALELLKKC